MNNFIDSLLIIIVIYNTSLEDCESFQSVNRMKDEYSDLNLFVYDNSNQPQKINSYKGISISYIHDRLNSGVSMAYNQGVSYAKKMDKRWVLLLDQDTTLPATLLYEYQKALLGFPDIKLFAPILVLKNKKIFSPSRYRFKRGFYLKGISEGIHSLYRICPVNSGMLINVEAFLSVNGYNDKVKLDFGDFQFIERFRKLYPNFYVLNVECQQDFSNDDISYTSQLNRFLYYCQGAKNIEKDTVWDRFQYTVIVGVRAMSLTLKHKKIGFISTYFRSFLISK